MSTLRPIRRAIQAAAPFVLIAALVTSSETAAQTPTGGGLDAALFGELEYRSIGPSRGGRVTAVHGVAQQPGTYYMGSTGGGVWKSEDYGRNWRPIADAYLETGSIGAIEVAAADPGVVYVGTGSDGIRSNIITGRGVYKSTDAGETWSFVGLRDVGQIGAVEAHPGNPDIVYVAAIGHAFGPNRDRGVYKSTDGGRTWRNVLFVSDSTGAVDLELAPDNPNEIYASMWRGERKPWTIISGAREGGIWKSEDGGESWRKLEGGLPDGLFGKSDLAVSAADPDRVYALIEAPEPEDGLYRSDDRGRTWRQVSSFNPLLNRPFYYTNVDADPTDADIVYVNNEGFFRSVDAGANWERVSTPHGDNHDMWIDPNDPDVWVQSNDGGVNVTLDAGRTWSTQLNQPTAELYQAAVDNRFPYWVYAGQQDNSTIGVPSRPPATWGPDHRAGWWIHVGGCETGPVVPKPDDWRIVYANCKGRFGVYSHVTGQEQQYYVGASNMYGHNPRDLQYRFQRVSPIEVSPHDPEVVYHASQFLHRTSDGGVTWETISPDLTWNPTEGQVVSGSPITRDITGEEFYSTIYAVEESPLEPGLIWVGSNDGLVHVTRDGGRTWTDVTPPDLPPGGRVQSVAPSPHDPAKAYVAVYRFLYADDFEPYIYRTVDFGRSWSRLTTGENGIPADFPTRVVREDPDRAGLLYAGTEFGMFISFDDGAFWQPLQLNLPRTPITDIIVHQQDLVFSTMGRGFWILDDVSRLQQLSPQVASAEVQLFRPRAAYRTRYRGGFGFQAPNPADPRFPPPGATIDYYVASEPAGEVTLEILDASGTVIRSFSSDAPGEVSAVAQDMREPFLLRMGTPRLAKAAGAHRFTWGLDLSGPWHADEGRSGRGGPMVLPGDYQVRLTANGVSQTQPLTVRIDPRLPEAGVTLADLEEQLELNLQIRDAVTEARMAAARIEAAHQRLTEAPAEDVAERLADIERRLLTASEPGIRYPQPMLLAQLEYLYSMSTTADQRPGRDAHARYSELRAELDALLGSLTETTSAIAAAGRPFDRP
ncbi:MAG: hypothetical protein ACRELD_04420 [Longimicrobiales bacterium]